MEGPPAGAPAAETPQTETPPLKTPEHVVHRRERFDGDFSTLVSLFAEQVPSSGIVYSTALSAPVDQRNLIRNKSLLQGLKKEQANMCYKITTIRSALAEHPSAAKMAKQEKKVWINDNTNRISVMCTHTMRAHRRIRKPAWVSEVLDNTKSVVSQLQVFTYTYKQKHV